jgi:hypothetical protein
MSTDNTPFPAPDSTAPGTGNTPRTVRVILTGTLARTPGALRTGKFTHRRLECILTVRTEHIYFVRSSDREQVCPAYTVRVGSLFSPVLFRCADKGDRVIIPAHLTPGTRRMSARVVFAAGG